MSAADATISELKDRIEANRHMFRVGVKGLELKTRETARETLGSPATPVAIFAGCLGLGLFFGRRRRKKTKEEKAVLQPRPTFVDELGKLLSIARKNAVWIGPMIANWQKNREETEQVKAAAQAPYPETEPPS
jgi:hypothetical protein